MLSATLLSLAVDESYLNGINYGEQGVKRVMMPDNVVTTYGAVCLDGTAAGFYYSPPSGAGSNASWQIYFEGGVTTQPRTGASPASSRFTPLA